MFDSKAKKLKTILLGVFAFLLAAGLFLTVFGAVLGSSVKDEISRKTDGNTNIISVMGDDIITAAKGGKTLYKLNGEGGIFEIANFDSEIVSTAAKGNITVVSLGNRDNVVLNSKGEMLATFNIGYPVTHFDYSDEQKSMIIASSISTTQNYIFAFENIDWKENINYTFRIVPRVMPMGVGIDGDKFYYAGYNSNVYNIYGTGSIVGKEETVYTYNNPMQSFFVADGGKFVIGSQTGHLTVVDGENTLTKKVGNMPVKADYYRGETFAAVTDNGKAYLVDFSSGKLKVTSTSGISTPDGFVYTKSGDLVIIRGGVIKCVNYLIARSGKISSAMLPAGIVLLIVSAAAVIILAVLLKSKKGAEYISSTSLKVWKAKRYYLMLLPLFALLAIFIYYPVVWGFAIAFQRYQNGVFVEWVFLDNFKTIFTNSYFLSSIKNMLIFLVTDVLKALVVPVIIAELLLGLKSYKSQYAARVLMYIPGILPGVATMLLWRYGIYGTNGLFNQMFKALGITSLATHDFLGSESTALSSLIFMGFPWVGSYIIVYGALAGVPKSFYEAAKLEGLGAFKRVFYIDLPMIFAQLKYIFVTSFIGSMQDFNRVYLTTEGGPGTATYIPALELYFNINKFNNYGAAAAMGIFLFVIIFVSSMCILKIKRNSEVAL